MSAMRKVASYLGFVEEDEDFETARRDARREEPQDDYADDFDYEEPSAEPAPAESRPAATISPIRASVRPVETASAASLHTIRTIHPRSYNDAKAIGTAFREGVPVIMDLSAMDEANSKRLVDFSAGLIFGLHGSIEKVTNSVFLLSPEQVSVTTEAEDRADDQASFFNQS